MWDLIATLDTYKELQGLSIPPLIIVGSEDASTPIAAAKTLADALNTKLLHVVPDVSHLLNIEAPQMINKLLQDFLRSI